jgi:hypothetical protein
MTTSKLKTRAVRWIYQSLLIELSEPFDGKNERLWFAEPRIDESANTFGMALLQADDSQTDKALKVPFGTFFNCFSVHDEAIN